MLFFNGGENFAYNFRGKKGSVSSNLPMGTKLSLSSAFPQVSKFRDGLRTNFLQVIRGDKVIIGTDGLGDLSPVDTKSREYVGRLLLPYVDNDVDKIVNFSQYGIRVYHKHLNS